MACGRIYSKAAEWRTQESCPQVPYCGNTGVAVPYPSWSLCLTMAGHTRFSDWCRYSCRDGQLAPRGSFFLTPISERLAWALEVDKRHSPAPNPTQHLVKIRLSFSLSILFQLSWNIPFLSQSGAFLLRDNSLTCPLTLKW